MLIAPMICTIRKMKPFFMQLLVGMLGADLLLLFFHVISPPPKPIVTVDVTTMIQRFIKTETDAKLPPDQLKENIITFGKQLENTLDAVAHDQQVVLLPKEAVIAGTKDITSDIEKKLGSQLKTSLPSAPTS